MQYTGTVAPFELRMLPIAGNMHPMMEGGASLHIILDII